MYIYIYTIYAGDWNAKHPAWRCSNICTTGRRLHSDSVRNNYEVVGPDEPTHYSNAAAHQPSTIDLVVHRGFAALDLETLQDAFGSDHLPVLVSLSGRLTLAGAPPPSRRISWEQYEALLLQRPLISEPLNDAESIDRLEANITSSIQEALRDASVPFSSRALPPIPRRIQALIDQKRKIRADWKTSRDPCLKRKLNHLIEQIKAALEDSAADSWDRRIAEACDDQSSLNKLCRQLTKKKPPVRPLYHPDGHLTYLADERVEILADYLATQFQPNPSERPEFHADVVKEVEHRLLHPPLPMPPPPFFTPMMVKREIKHLKPRKAPGKDGVTNAALRHLPLKYIAGLTRLFSAILRLGYFPQVWKEGLVIMIPKPGKNQRRPEGFRPITLLSSSAKLFEKLTLPLLMAHLQPRPEQFGFRSGHSTTLQVARILHFAATAINRKESAVAAFLDVASAFDRVWHPGLLWKILHAGMPHHLALVLAAFLQGRTFRVRLEGCISRSHPIAAGVPQGSTWSPALYSCYTDDIPVQQDATLALYADDIALISKSLNHIHAAVKLQRALDLLPNWLAEWRLTINVTKTQAISFGVHLKPPPPLSLLGQRIDWSPQATYLGVVVDRRLTMIGHVRHATSSAKTALFLLRPLLRSHLPLRIKLALYKSYVRPRLTYAAPAWYALTNPCLRKNLQVVQNIALRRVTQAPYFVRNATLLRDLKMESLEEHIGRLSSNAFSRADVSDHLHLQDIAPWHSRPPDICRLPRDSLPPPSSDS